MGSRDSLHLLDSDSCIFYFLNAVGDLDCTFGNARTSTNEGISVSRDLDILIRPLETENDFSKFEALQRETWGAHIEEAVTTPLAKIIQKIGGIAAGAFNRQGEMLGFVFGFAGLSEGKPVHWSHMLAVRDQARNAGIGRRLKLYQREVLLKMGIESVYWTYDPLVAKNAQFNLNSLGGEVLKYVENMYGPGEDSDLFRGIGTDRFVVVWHIKGEKVRAALEQNHIFDCSPFLTSALAVCRSAEGDPLSAPVDKTDVNDSKVRVEIPRDVHELMKKSLPITSEWRRKTRDAFRRYTDRKYKVVGVYCDQACGRFFYCMERSD